VILALDKARSRKEPNLAVRGLTDVGDVILCQKSLKKSCRMGRRIVMTKLICSLGHCECNCHTAYKVNSVSLLTDYTMRESLFNDAQ
jgi:hypothetical protein